MKNLTYQIPLSRRLICTSIYFVVQCCEIDFATIVGPWSKLHCTILIIKRKPFNVYDTGTNIKTCKHGDTDVLLCGLWSIPHTTTDTSEMQRVRAKKSQSFKRGHSSKQASLLKMAKSQRYRTRFKRLQWWPLHDWRNLKIPTSKESYWTRKRKKIKSKS